MAIHLARVNVRAYAALNPMMYTFGFQIEATSTDDPETLEGALINNLDVAGGWLEKLCAAHADTEEDTWRIASVFAKVVDVSSRGFYRFSSTLDNNAGTNDALTLMPIEVCYPLIWTTGFPKNDGRMYAVGYTERFSAGSPLPIETLPDLLAFGNYHVSTHVFTTFTLQGVVLAAAPGGPGFTAINGVTQGYTAWKQGRRRYPIGG